MVLLNIHAPAYLVEFRRKLTKIGLSLPGAEVHLSTTTQTPVYQKIDFTSCSLNEVSVLGELVRVRERGIERHGFCAHHMSNLCIIIVTSHPKFYCI